ncbi:MAG TPA: MarR family transcriptional regulator [Acidimicrobiales bacterium]|nr:MarR family transcriptional regulator [Acidimicrobiales bacterium]
MTAKPRLATTFAEEEQSPGLLLWRVTNRWQAAQRAALRPHRLTHGQFVLLASLTWLDRDAPVTQRQLASHAVMDEMMTSQVVRSLETRGLVRRLPHPTDARARDISVTDEGVALANRAIVDVEACDRRFFAVLGDRLPAVTRALASLSHADS